MYTIQIENDLDLNITIKFLGNYYICLYIFICIIHIIMVYINYINSKNIDNYCTMKSHNCQLINYSANSCDVKQSNK